MVGLSSMPRLPSLSDLVRVLQAQTEALASLPSTMMSLNKSVRGMIEVVAQAGETAAAVQRLTRKLELLVDTLDEPVRALAPGLRKVAVILESDVIDEIPGTLALVNSEILPILKALADTQAKVAGIAGTTDRMMSMIDDVQARVATLPGAGMLARRAGKLVRPE